MSDNSRFTTEGRPTCGTCPHWSADEDETGMGWCHRYPPKIVPDDECTRAYVIRSDFCGEHPDMPSWIAGRAKREAAEPVPATTTADDTPAALIAALREHTEALRAARESPAPSPPQEQESRTPVGDRLRAAAWEAIRQVLDFRLGEDDREFHDLTAAAEAYDALPAAPPRTTVEEFCSTTEGRALFEQEAAGLAASEAFARRTGAGDRLWDAVRPAIARTQDAGLICTDVQYRDLLAASETYRALPAAPAPDPDRVVVDRAALEELRAAARSVADPREVSQGDARAACKRLVIAIAAFDDPKAQKHHPAIAGNRLTPEAIEAGRRGVAGAYKFADDSRRDADRE